MRRIAIVGGGQAGLPLALGLLDKGYEVTVVTNREPDDIRRGKVMSSQCMFDASLQIERDLGLNQWEAACPPVEGIGLAVPCLLYTSSTSRAAVLTFTMPMMSALLAWAVLGERLDRRRGLALLLGGLGVAVLALSLIHI